MIYAITAVPKPRQTRSDRWKQRPAVMRYRAFADECRALRMDLPDHGAHIIFHIPMPTSWSRKKRAEMNGQPHRSRPDADNMVKALFDATRGEDSGIWDFRATKRWAEHGAIEITTDTYQQADDAGLAG